MFLNLKGKDNCEVVQLKIEIENKRINDILEFILIIHYIKHRTNLLEVYFCKSEWIKQIYSFY